MDGSAYSVIVIKYNILVPLSIESDPALASHAIQVSLFTQWSTWQGYQLTLQQTYGSAGSILTNPITSAYNTSGAHRSISNSI